MYGALIFSGNVFPSQGGPCGSCCEACASGAGACDGGPLLGPAEGCQTGACPLPGRPANTVVFEEVASGAYFDADAAAQQAARVGARRSARAAGDWTRAAGDGEDLADAFADLDREVARGGNVTAATLSEAARTRNNQTPAQWAALPQPNRDRLIVAELARLTPAQRSAAWPSLSPAQREAALAQIGRNAGLSEAEARQFAERERTADYALVTGLVTQGVGVLRDLITNSNQQELERIRQNARTAVARYGLETNAEGEFLNVFRQSQGVTGGTTNPVTTTRSGGGGAMMAAAVVALALLAGGKR